MAKRIKLPKVNYNKIIKHSYRDEWEYGYSIVKYDYSSVSGTNDYSSIVNGRITEINHLVLYENICKKYSIDNIRDYCLDRFIKKSLNTDVVSFVVSSGYYGDEAGYKISDSFTEQLNLMIDRINNIDEDESLLIEDILILEYGYILPELKNRKWSFHKNIELDRIHPAAGMRHVQMNIVNEYKKQYEVDKYNLVCLCSGALRLIDGYHRYSAANQLKLKTIDVVLCE